MASDSAGMTSEAAAGAEFEALRLQGLRKVVADRMTASLREMAQLTLHRTADARGLISRRAALPAGSRPSINDLVLAATSSVLVRHPGVNATLEDDTIRQWRVVHLGFAVAVEEGLVVPVIRNAHTLPPPALREEAARLSHAARERRLTLSDIQGGTFTVTNLGALGIDAFTPIINPPQVAILGVGRVNNNKISLSLTIDHRALDGLPGARFLEDLSHELEDGVEAL